MTRLRARAFLSLFVLILLARVPEAVAAVAGIEEAPCAADCGNENQEGQCPPNCNQGACAKISPTLSPPTTAMPLPEAVDQVAVSVPSPLITVLPSGGVFHPPRA